MSLLYFILSGLLLYFMLKLGSKILMALTGRKVITNSIAKWFPLFETGVWVFFAFWGAYVLFGGISHYDHLVFVMAVLLAIGVSWFFFRDFFAGMIMKSECRLELGQHIKTPDFEGTIVLLGPRYMELEIDSGEKLKVSYSRLNKHWISLPAETEKSLSNNLTLRIPDSANPLQVKTIVYKEMMGMPWIVGTPPKLKLTKNEDDQSFLDIRYGLLKEEHSLLVEHRIRQTIKTLSGL